MDPKSLPIRRYQQAIVDSVRAHPVTVVIGETGSGKTTQIAQILEEAGFAADGGVIGVTQPRRVVCGGRVWRGCGVGGACSRPIPAVPSTVALCLYFWPACIPPQQEYEPAAGCPPTLHKP